MAGGRRKLPVLAEVSGFAPEGEQVWSLRRTDFERLSGLQAQLGSKGVLVSGDDALCGALAIALAGAASAAGRRTILVECDLARPRLAVDLGLEQSPGLHEYLRWEATPEEIVQSLALAGPAAAGAQEPLVFVSAGRQAREPGTLLGLQSFRHVTAKLRHAYDLVVMVGPALGEGGPGLAAVAAGTDGVLAAVAPGEVKGRSGRELRASLGDLPAAVIGAVVVGAGE
jgi:Mrp family chromosome partitioning ATPase